MIHFGNWKRWTCCAGACFLLALSGVANEVESPEFSTQSVLELKHSVGNPRNSEGSFVRLQDGRLLFAYTRYTGDSWSDDAVADIACRYSSDQGKTWDSQDRILLANDALNVMSVSLLRLQDGRIAMVYLRKELSPLGMITCKPYIRFSEDEAQTWSAPFDIVGVPGYFVVNNDRLIQLQSGRLLIPAAFHRYKRHANGAIDTDIHGIGLFYYSDDGGTTWQESAEWVLPPSSQILSGFHEPGVIELADGNLLAWFRTTDGAQYTATSADQGQHWSAPRRAEEFLSSESPMSMKRNPVTGELVAIWNDQDPRWEVRRESASWGRTPLVLAVSRDEGKSWERHQVLEDAPDHGYCYIAMLFNGEDLLLGYCAGGGDSAVLQDLKLSYLTPSER